MYCSTPGFPLHHKLLELAHTHVHQVGDAIQLSHLLSSPSPPVFNLTQHRGLFQWVSSLHQFSSVQSLSHVRLCDSMDCSSPGLPVHHQFLEFTQTHVHWVSDAIQPSHPLLSSSPPAFNLCQHQGLFQWVRSLHQVAKVLELQLQHQPFQWIFRTDFL